MTDSENKVFIFKVVLKRRKSIWRKIAIRGDQSLSKLHSAIFRAFDRYDPHLYCFYFSSKPTSTSRARLQGARSYGCPHSETDHKAEHTNIERLRLRLKSKFEYLFDYGDEWWHEITLEDIQITPQPGITYPCVIASRGESPPQYDDVGDD